MAEASEEQTPGDRFVKTFTQSELKLSFWHVSKLTPTFPEFSAPFSTPVLLPMRGGEDEMWLPEDIWWLFCCSFPPSSPSLSPLLAFSHRLIVVCRPPVLSVSLKRALIRQWWFRHILAEVMFAYLVSLLQSLHPPLLCPLPLLPHLLPSLAAPSTLTGSLLPACHLWSGWKLWLFLQHGAALR